MKKVLVIVGPTGVGKTDFSIELAQRFDAEIISGDSIQVFKHMDIGSGKIKKEEMKGIVHHGIDILSLKEKYSVADFQKQARDAIEDITSRKKVAMIVGGTGLYIKACLYDYEFESQEEVDEEKLKELEALSNEELHKKLQDIDPSQADKIHVNNRQRLIRACLIYEMHKITKTEQIEKQEHKLLYDALIIGCTMEREQLYQRINTRVSGMIEEGLKEEVEGLLEKGVSFDDHAMQGIGYREWKAYLMGLKQLMRLKEIYKRILVSLRSDSIHGSIIKWIHIG